MAYNKSSYLQGIMTLEQKKDAERICQAIEADVMGLRKENEKKVYQSSADEKNRMIEKLRAIGSKIEGDYSNSTENGLFGSMFSPAFINAFSRHTSTSYSIWKGSDNLYAIKLFYWNYDNNRYKNTIFEIIESYSKKPWPTATAREMVSAAPEWCKVTDVSEIHQRIVNFYNSEERQEAASRFVIYQGNSERFRRKIYLLFFWAFMILVLSGEDTEIDEGIDKLSLICDMAVLCRMSKEAVEDIVYFVLCAFDKGYERNCMTKDVQKYLSGIFELHPVKSMAEDDVNPSVSEPEKECDESQPVIKNNNNKTVSAPQKELKPLIASDFFGDRIDVDVTRAFPVVVMATMSSGKSTLINALLGADILPNRNEACTAKIYSIFDDDNATEAGLYLTRSDGTTAEFMQSQTDLADELDKANNDNDVDKILLCGNIKGVQNTDRSLLLIDTPGPNNSRDDSHAKVTEGVLDQIYGGLILYVMNATQMGVYDDRSFLQLISSKLQQKNDLKIIFVINKLDQLDEEKESILDFLMKTEQYLESNEIKNPKIVPVSALAAGLFKKVERGESLTRKQKHDFQEMYDIFEPKGLSLGVYGATSHLSELQREEEVAGEKYTVMQLERAIENTGLTCLERKIQEYQILSSDFGSVEINLSKEKSEKKVKKDFFDIYAVSTMSTGKSTLLNALLHTQLLPARHEACTTTEICIKDVSKSGYTAVCYGENRDTIVYPMKEVTAEDIKNYNEDKRVSYIDVAGRIPGISNKIFCPRLYDISSPNNSRNSNHQSHLMQTLFGDKSQNNLRLVNGIILYVMNVTTFAISDDEKLLRRISEEMKAGDDVTRKKFIFVLNKCDEIDESRGETVESFLQNIREYLMGFGIEAPTIIPTCARIALLIQKDKNGEQLERHEKRELNMVDDFVENEAMHFEQYAVVPDTVQSIVNRKVKKYHNDQTTWPLEAYMHSGVGVLEEVINDYMKQVK